MHFSSKIYFWLLQSLRNGPGRSFQQQSRRLPGGVHKYPEHVYQENMHYHVFTIQWLAIFLCSEESGNYCMTTKFCPSRFIKMGSSFLIWKQQMKEELPAFNRKVTVLKYEIEWCYENAFYYIPTLLIVLILS